MANRDWSKWFGSKNTAKPYTAKCKVAPNFLQVPRNTKINWKEAKRHRKRPKGPKLEAQVGSFNGRRREKMKESFPKFIFYNQLNLSGTQIKVFQPPLSTRATRHGHEMCVCVGERERERESAREIIFLAVPTVFPYLSWGSDSAQRSGRFAFFISDINYVGRKSWQRRLHARWWSHRWTCFRSWLAYKSWPFKLSVSTSLA